MPTKFPARLHVLLARQSDYALVIWRGPSKQTRFIGWDRKTDRFEPSQWLKGRVYERRSDISPDGKHVIYFAMNGKWASRTNGSWTAISEAPWMKAKVLWAKGDCWHGGGLFIDHRLYWLNDGYGHRLLEDDKALRQQTNYQPEAYYGGECPGVYFLRLLRDGWQLKSDTSKASWRKTTIFEKLLSHGWLLQKIAHAQTNPPPGKGCYWDEHVLQRGEEIWADYPDWEWADWDGQRLLWASKGCLWACEVAGAKLGEFKQLYNFNEMKFEPIAAPY